MQRLTPKQYAQTLFEVLQDTTSTDYDKVLENFMDAIRINGDQNIAGAILIEYVELAKTYNTGQNSSHDVIEQLNKVAKEAGTSNAPNGVVFKLDD